MASFLAEYHVFWLIFVGLFGLCLGSFAGALAWRLPRNIKISGKRRSACPQCKTPLGVRDLVPALSWIVQRGRCRHCGAAIPKDYILIEVTTAIIALCFFSVYQYQLVTPVLIFAAPIMTAMIAIDLRHMIIPDRLNLVLAGFGLCLLAAAGFDAPSHIVESIWLQAVIGAVVYFVFAYILTLGVSFVLKKQAMGGGDIKFFAVAGLWLGPAVLPIFLMMSGAMGVIFGLVSKHLTKQEYFPFGPALIVSFILLIIMEKTVFLTLL